MIRAYRNQDLQPISDLWLQTSLQCHNFIAESFWQNNLENIKNIYIPNSQTFVFEDKHKIKGFISLMNENFIGACFVRKEFQNKRIGSKLIKFAQHHHSALQLQVYTKNQKAINFYHKHGFKIVDESICPDTREKQLLMSWSLGCPPNRTYRRAGDS